jgi:glutaconate CoA-transferase subunit A
LIRWRYASERTIVTVEKLHDGKSPGRQDPGGRHPARLLCRDVAVVENGCWPLPLPEYYAWDVEHLKEYVKLAATDEGFAKYLDQYVYERRAA